MMEKLVLESRSHMCDRLAILFTQLRPRSEELAKLTLANLISVIAQLLEE